MHIPFTRIVSFRHLEGAKEDERTLLYWRICFQKTQFTLPGKTLLLCFPFSEAGSRDFLDFIFV